MLCLSFPPAAADIAAAVEEVDAPLPEKAEEARVEAEQILSMPVFEKARAKEGVAARVGRWLIKKLREIGSFISDLLPEFAGIGTGISYAVTAGLLLLLAALIWYWFLRNRDLRLRAMPRFEPDEGGDTPASAPSLADAEEALRAGDLAGAAARITEWFMAVAYLPASPPEGRTNREMLPELKRRPPLAPKDWEALVRFHESLRYAGRSTEKKVVDAWFRAARGVAG